MQIDTMLVHRLIETQIPQWKHFPIKPVKPGGWDNKTFHLGEDLLVRMPSAAQYAMQIEKEFRWLPILTPLLPFYIPIPLVIGKPTKEYPWQWGVYCWLDGETIAMSKNVDLNQLAQNLAHFLHTLHTIDPVGGPLPGEQNFYRGGSLKVYDTEVHQAINLLKGKIDINYGLNIWEEALSTRWHRAPVWVHGDIATNNLLIKNKRLNAVIDFGCLAIGDPACDLAIAWTLFKDESREIFRSMLPLDSGTWARGRAWALWKNLIIAAGITDTNTIERTQSWYTIHEVLADKNFDK